MMLSPVPCPSLVEDELKIHAGSNVATSVMKRIQRKTDILISNFPTPIPTSTLPLSSSIFFPTRDKTQILFLCSYYAPDIRIFISILSNQSVSGGYAAPDISERTMGGCCCCCSSKGTEHSSAPTYYYYPRASEEHFPLSSHRAPVSLLSMGLLVDTNLDTSIPDTYRAPPAPIPYDVAVGCPHSPPVAQEMCGKKGDVTVQTTNSDSAQATTECDSRVPSIKPEELKEDCKVHSDSKLGLAKQSEIELAKTMESIALATEEDVCPICLEEYEDENPKITTKCEHHFHLGCILEWMERSDTCPVCDQEMIFDPPID